LEEEFSKFVADYKPEEAAAIPAISPNGRLRKDEPKYINITPESEPCLLRKGDLLVARTGATYGKTVLFDEDYPAIFASYLIRLRFPMDRLIKCSDLTGLIYTR
jgi:hypothetical protein